MPEFVNTPNFYQDSDILSKINLPKEESTLQVQRQIIQVFNGTMFCPLIKAVFF
ncbi:hypothetical protein EfmJHP36_33210 (plasmid) [Enterococcus faecium]|nr:hypothetical protein EfmJHP36_33210 [Enterococcus faecium]